MAYVEINPRTLGSPQLGELSDLAFRLYFSGLTYIADQYGSGPAWDVIPGDDVYCLVNGRPRQAVQKAVVELWSATRWGGALWLLTDGYDYGVLPSRWWRIKVAESDPFGAVRAEARRNYRDLVYERDEWRCRFCGTEERLSIDHIVPLSRGGTNDLDNLQTLCRSCNSKKGAKV